jgi:hypothetical protein
VTYVYIAAHFRRRIYRIRCMTPLLATGREVAKLGRWQDIGRTRSAGAR